MSKKGVYNFEEKGNLEKPFIIGRIARFALGLACLYFIYQLILYGEGVIYSLESNVMTWFAVITAFYLTNHVVSIGFGKKWGQMPRTILIMISGGLILISLYTEGQVLGTSFRYFLYTYLFYFYLHLGVSFVISAFVATPGCEMRSIPHLYTILTGKKTQEHYCPGFIGDLDRWEKRKFANTEN